MKFRLRTYGNPYELTKWLPMKKRKKLVNNICSFYRAMLGFRLSLGRKHSTL